MKKIIAGLIIFIFLISIMSMYQVKEYEKGVVLRFEKPIKSVTKPGLHFKIPFVDKFEKFDGRILGYDSSPREVYTKDKKNLVLDNYAKWRITDPIVFLEKVRNERGALIQLDNTIYSELRNEIGTYTLSEIIGDKREEIMNKVTKVSNEKTKTIGIEVVDVRIKRVDLPQQNEKNVYERMRAERAQQAKKYRAEGMQIAQEIRSEADKESTIIIAEAERKAEELKGEGDAEALQIYANVYNKDREFYQFIRTLEAYEKIFKGNGKNSIILSSDSEVWKYLDGAK